MAHGLDHSELASSDCEGTRVMCELKSDGAEVILRRIADTRSLEARSFAGNFQAVDYRASLNSTVICRLSRNARGRRHPTTQNNIKETTTSAYMVADASDLFVV